MSRKAKPPAFDSDNPEWTRADFAAATRFPSGTRLKDMKPSELDRLIRKRGPQKAPTKVPVSIRLSPEVVKHFKAKGPGWQARIDDALRKIVKKAG
ncbi:BrnA antitoxin family protein [Bradyrhizobium sp. Ai1a-2]|uniref:BrnA antitoxin family protein n=1 Tax=Bradyrhizobium sp. Ai1a-2 TaxID=196490 RepID=UPI00040822F2|nr:BrnA antitoxin family protein [Bradyrhizobium sp. Ai1a-2]